MMLSGRKGLILGVANDASIATGCAEALVSQGAEVMLSYGHPKAGTFVQPIADRLNTGLAVYADAGDEVSLDALFFQVKSTLGRLDFLIHSIAFAPAADLQGPLTDCSRSGFLEAMDISCYSLIACAQRARPLMKEGGSILTMSYYGAEKYVPHYNLMGPVKAALEHCVRYLAWELGPESIRVNALSPGPLSTRAAGGLAHFQSMKNIIDEKKPVKAALDNRQVGDLAAFLVSDASRNITGEVIHIDGGYHLAG